MPTLRNLLAAALLCLVLSGCSQELVDPTPLIEQRDAQLETALEQEQKALDSYIEKENSTLPALLETYEGLYSSASISGRIQEVTDRPGLDDGVYAIVQFDYIYAAPVDWGAATAALDGQRAAIDDLCATQVFPAMRASGLTGNIGAVYTYSDGRGSFGPMWQHGCNE